MSDDMCFDENIIMYGDVGKIKENPNGKFYDL